MSRHIVHSAPIAGLLIPRQINESKNQHLLCTMPFLTGGQKVNRIQDGYFRYTIFRTKVESFDTFNNLGDQFGRGQLGRLQLAHGYRTVWLDADSQQYLPAQCRVRAQFSVIYPIKRRLVPIEYDLDLFVGSTRSKSIAQRSRRFLQIRNITFDPHNAHTIAVSVT